MPTERTVERADGTVERTTTTDGQPVIQERRGGGMGGIVALVVGLLLVGVVGYFLLNMSQREQVKRRSGSR
jgi:type VI protein secretion system component VasF